MVEARPRGFPAANDGDLIPGHKLRIAQGVQDQRGIMNVPQRFRVTGVRPGHHTDAMAEAVMLNHPGGRHGRVGSVRRLPGLNGAKDLGGQLPMRVISMPSRLRSLPSE